MKAIMFPGISPSLGPVRYLAARGGRETRLNESNKEKKNKKHKNVVYQLVLLTAKGTHTENAHWRGGYWNWDKNEVECKTESTRDRRICFPLLPSTCLAHRGEMNGILRVGGRRWRNFQKCFCWCCSFPPVRVRVRVCRNISHFATKKKGFSYLFAPLRGCSGSLHGSFRMLIFIIIK